MVPVFRPAGMCAGASARIRLPGRIDAEDRRGQDRSEQGPSWPKGGAQQRSPGSPFGHALSTVARAREVPRASSIPLRTRSTGAEPDRIDWETAAGSGGAEVRVHHAEQIAHAD